MNRKEFAQFLNCDMSADGTSPTYVQIGSGATSLVTELNYDVSSEVDVIGISTTEATLGTAQSTVDVYKPKTATDELYIFAQNIIDNRLENESLKTDIVEVKKWVEASDGVYEAYKEEVYFIPTSYGGEGKYDVPYTINHTNVRVKGTFTVATKTFTPEA